MTHIWQGLRTGEWLTAARMRAYSLILLGLSVLVFAGWIAVSDGLIDRNGRPIGTDFSNVYAAGMLTWQGRSADAYAPALRHAAEKAVIDATSRSACSLLPGPLGLLVELAHYACVLRRAALDRASHAVGAPHVAQA
jgi:hypothetical protein